MENGKKWKIADIAVGLIGGICGVIGIITSLKSASYDEEQQYAALEERYGLTPVSNEEGASE